MPEVRFISPVAVWGGGSQIIKTYTIIDNIIDSRAFYSTIYISAELYFITICISRYGHACAVVGNQMYIFAGASEDSGTVKYFNDMHIFHCEFSPWGCPIPIL